MGKSLKMSRNSCGMPSGGCVIRFVTRGFAFVFIFRCGCVGVCVMKVVCFVLVLLLVLFCFATGLLWCSLVYLAKDRPRKKTTENGGESV
jgi:hypothetical protein